LTMKNAVYFAIFLYFLRKVMWRLLPVASGTPWVVLWLLRYEDEPGSTRDRYVRVYEGHSAVAAGWARDTMILNDWNREFIVLCRKGQQRDIRILDLQDDFSEIYDLMDEFSADELRDIAQKARSI